MSSKSSQLTIVGAPIYHGQVNIGPGLALDSLVNSGDLLSKLYESGWKEINFLDTEITRPKPSDVDTKRESSSESESIHSFKLNNQKMVGDDCAKIYNCLAKAIEVYPKSTILTIGGDHSIASPSIMALLNLKKAPISVIYVDAHLDINTPMTTPSGNYHGMSLAHTLDWFWKKDKIRWISGFDFANFRVRSLEERRLAFIGSRDIDTEERRRLSRSDIHIFDMNMIKKDGIESVIDQALKAVNPDGDAHVHLSFDIDSVDPSIAPGTGTTSPDGLSESSALYIVQEMARREQLHSMDLVELDFTRDNAKRDTYNLVLKIVQSLGGNRLISDI